MLRFRFIERIGEDPLQNSVKLANIDFHRDFRDFRRRPRAEHMEITGIIHNILGRTDPGFPTPGVKMTVGYTNSLKSKRQREM